MPPLLADFIHARGCKPICEKSLTLPDIKAYKLISIIRISPGVGTHTWRYFSHRQSPKDCHDNTQKAHKLGNYSNPVSSPVKSNG